MFKAKYKKITDKDFKRNFGNTTHECLMYCFLFFMPFVFLFPPHFYIWTFTMTDGWDFDYHVFSPQAIVNSFYYVWKNLWKCLVAYAIIAYVWVAEGCICTYIYGILFDWLILKPYHFLIWRPFVLKEDVLVISPEDKVEKIKSCHPEHWYYFHVKYRGYRLPNAGDLHKITEYLESNS